MKSNPAKLNPRCWNCDKTMTATLRSITVFCCPKCERDYNRTEQGSTLTPVVAILTVFSVGAVLIAQSGIVNALVARFAQVIQ